MRDVPASMEKIWRSGQYFGDQRPFARVTVQRPHMKLHNVSFPAKADPNLSGATSPSGTTASTTGTQAHTIQETYANFLFGPDATVPKELPNVKDVQWQRSVDSDVASATITFWNTSPLPLGETPTRDLDRPGYYTYSRGDTAFASRWEQQKNEWAGMLMPDNLLRTYEGYGFTEGVPPERDTKLVLTGVWMIDTVAYTHNGTITVTCRDLGRLLLDQIVFPPITPADFYPLSFTKVDKASGFIEGVTYITRVEVTNGVATPLDTPQSGITPQSGVTQPNIGTPVALPVSYDTSSNYVFESHSFNYVVKTGDYLIKLADRYKVSGGWRAIYDLNKARIDSVAHDHGMPGGGHWIFPGETLKIPGYGGSTGTDLDTNGHLAQYAFDASQASYWLSVGHDKGNRAQDYEWVQGNLGGATITQVRVNIVKSDYTMYVSVWDGQRWVKSKSTDVIPYRAASKSTDNGADIAYAAKMVCNKGGGVYTVTFPKPIPNAKKVRITFHNLQKFEQNTTGGDYHAGVQNVDVYGYKQNSTPAPAKPTPPVQMSPFIKGIVDDFNKGTNLTSLGRASATGDLWQYKDGGSGKDTIWYRQDGSAHRKGGHEGTGKLMWAINDLQYRHQRMDGKVRGFDLKPTENPVWFLAMRFRQRGTEIYHVEASCTRRGLVSINLVRDNVRTVIAATQVGNPNTFDLADGSMRLRAWIKDRTVQVWVVKDDVATFGAPTLVATDERFNDAEMGYHLGFSTTSHKAGWGTFNGYGNFVGGVFDSFARPNAARIGSTESGQAWRLAGPAATSTAGKTADGWGVSSQRAKRTNSTRNGERLWAMANLGSITQDVIVRAYPNSSSGDLWMMALRARDSSNMIYYTVDQTGWLTIYSVIAGVPTQMFRAQQPNAPYTDRTVLHASIIDTELSIWIDGHLAYQVDDPDHYGNPGLGSLVGFGSDTTDIVYDVFEATVPGTSGGGPGTDDDPLTTIVEYETYVPPHIEPGAGAKPGTYEDYTDIIKLLCAWAGFYWPPDAIQRLSDGTVVPSSPGKEDPTLGREGIGRVWGDFEQTGTAGVSDLTMDLFDKKSLMDAITYVRDIIGFLFMIDETGAAVWRSPNIYAVGNNVAAFSTNPRHTTEMVEIDEKLTLMELTANLNSRNVRENVFIATSDGVTGATAAGWNANPVGLRRVGGWTDQNFASVEECQVMADLITLRQLFSYRTDSVSIPGFPKIQIDDQVRLYEQTSSEGYIHYVQGINSSLSMDTGEYTYGLDTHWLGEAPFEKWLFDPAQLSQATQDYLAAIRLERDGDTWFELPRGTTIPDKLTVNVVFDGNALTRGANAGEGNDYPSQLGISLANNTTANLRRNNSAGTNITTPALITRADTTIDNQYDAATFDANILFMWEGSYHLANSITATGETAELASARVALTKAQKDQSSATNALAGYQSDLAKWQAQKQAADNAIPAAYADLLNAEMVLANVLPDSQEYYLASAQLSYSQTILDNLQEKRNMATTGISLDQAAITKTNTSLADANAAAIAAQKRIDAELKRLDSVELDETDIHDAIKAYCTARKAKGWKVAVLTILPRRDAAWSEGQAGRFEAIRILVNSLIRTHYLEYADALVDVAADAVFAKDSAYNDAAYYLSNKIYLTRAGYSLVSTYALGAATTIINAIGVTP